MNQRLFSGYGSRNQIRKILRETSPKKIFLVTGKKSYYLSGSAELLPPILQDHPFMRFSDFENNPKIDDIDKGVLLYKEGEFDMVLGVGGGSVLDTAKAISFLATQKGQSEEIIRTKASKTSREIPIILIPTTAGSGSESTHFSVIYLNKEKYSLAHPSMLADYAILDPVFTSRLPAYQTACSGMDALCQGIESYWSVNSTDESRHYSKQAIQLAYRNIVRCVNTPDKQSRENMMMASNYAGRAINIAKTTAAHAVSYAFTSFFDIPHGHAVALTLPSFIEFNSDLSKGTIQDKRGLEFVGDRLIEINQIFGLDHPLETKNNLNRIMKEAHLETSLSRLGIPEDGLEVILRNGFNPERMKNNPKIVGKSDLLEILKKIY